VSTHRIQDRAKITKSGFAVRLLVSTSLNTMHVTL